MAVENALGASLTAFERYAQEPEPPPVAPFAAADMERFWVPDFHLPGGLTPLGGTVFALALRGGQEAAELTPVPGSGGPDGRIAGCHPFMGQIPITDPDEIDARAARASARIPLFLRGFADDWRGAVAELELRYDRFAWAAAAARTNGDARACLTAALTLARRAWRIHFEFMFPLLAGYFAGRDELAKLGVDPALVPSLLQGYPSAITATDQALWQLAASARRHGADDSLADGDHAALPAGFRADLDNFLARYGARTPALYDVGLVPWQEDPSPALDLVAGLLRTPDASSFEATAGSAAERREDAERRAREAIGGADRRRFEQTLAALRAANFVWWNEEHNPAIDLRAHIPLRQAATMIGRAAGLSDPEATFYLFLPELEDLADDRLEPAAAQTLAATRADQHRAWQAQRDTLPLAAGTPPASFADPVMREIFGLTPDYVERLEFTRTETPVLHGMPVSAGSVRGRGRVLHDPGQLSDLQAGEILVCEATTPAWTPAFAIAAGCVCDLGGALTHAAIVSREYGLPCVTGIGTATRLLATGDLLEVDGAAGTVTVIERRAV